MVRKLPVFPERVLRIRSNRNFVYVVQESPGYQRTEDRVVDEIDPMISAAFHDGEFSEPVVIRFGITVGNMNRARGPVVGGTYEFEYAPVGPLGKPHHLIDIPLLSFDDDHAVLHELVHAVRREKGILLGLYEPDVNEIETDLEAIARMPARTLSKIVDRVMAGHAPPGQYERFVDNPMGKLAEDRKLLTGSLQKNIVGPVAYHTVKRLYHETNLSQLQVQSWKSMRRGGKCVCTPRLKPLKVRM